MTVRILLILLVTFTIFGGCQMLEPECKCKCVVDQPSGEPELNKALCFFDEMQLCIEAGGTFIECYPIAAEACEQ